MDNANPTLTERRSSGSNNVNGSVRRGGGSGSRGPGGPGPHLHISAPLPGSNMARPISLMDTSGHNPSTGHGLQMAPTGVPFHIVRVIVNKVEGGYGMKVSGDNPVFVQSVKPGGAAEKAGLHAGDKIMEVNGENVVSSTHTEVVALIRASSQVILTVQKRTGGPPRIMGSPNPEPRPNSTLNPSNRITGPQPVDNEKQYQLHREKEQYYRLMIEREQRYVDTLRGDIAKSPDDKKCKELEKTESRIQMLQVMLNDHTRNSNDLQSMSLDKAESPPPPLPTTPPPKLLPPKLARPNNNGNYSMDDDNPPPLPKRNQSKDVDNNNGNKLSVDESTGRGRTSSLGRRHTTADGSNYTRMVDNVLYQHHVPGESASNPPPLPPRHPPLTCSQDPHLGDAANSINKQLSYPLVATCATIINNYPLASPNAQQPPTHQRTKSSPESLGAVMTATKAAADASMMLIASESMTNLSGYELPGTPPGTPPPPYPSPSPGRRCYSNRSSGGNGLLDGADGGVSTGDGSFEIINADALSPDISPLRCHWVRILDNSSLIHAANPQTTQEMIMSMEDEDISDQEVLQMEDHGSFKSLSKLWESTPHLAVFMNYILSNSDPNSLLFYLLTDLYKEGNTKEMRKWAYEIHSCFLVPGAPLPLCNVDEQIAREIDDVLQREYDKEEILRRIFWKARNLAKQELQRQLSAFQQKRTAGLSTIYGPPDALLTELRNDKAKELKMYETMLVNKLELYLKDLEEDTYDPQKYIMAAALTTVVTRVFGVRPPSQDLDRCPTFVNKEKSFRTKLGIRFSRKLNILGHHFVAQPYFTVIRCSNCLQIIYGISPQGYECSACHINLHRHCVKLYDDACPGPINNKKDRGMLNIIDRIKPEKQHRRKHSSNFLQRERDECVAQTEPGSKESYVNRLSICCRFLRTRLVLLRCTVDENKLISKYTMWSNESVTNTAAADNKNMASLKSKISHRKRKGKNISPATTNPTDAPTSNNRKIKNNNKKSNKTKANGDINKNIGPDLLENVPSTVTDETDHAQPATQALIDNINNSSGNTDLTLDGDDEVVLRHSVRAPHVDEAVKACADSYNIDNNSDNIDVSLSQQITTSGGVVLDESLSRADDNTKKQPRRLSDLFRYGSTNHSSNSTDRDNSALKGRSQSKMITHFDIGENGQVTAKKVADLQANNSDPKDKQKTKDKTKLKKTAKEKDKEKDKPSGINLKRTDSNVSTRSLASTETKKPVFKQPDTPKAKIKIKEEKEATNSMLKRVKSKIYSSKHKNEPVIPPMPEINENFAVTKTSQNDQRKSTHFEFRLIRQSSNLESIRPRTMLGSTKQNSLDIPDHSLDYNQKPVLAKSKSSSAINLSLLRSRRNKGLDGKNKTCQEARSEFDFISFGGVNSTNLNKSVQVTRKFGSQNFMSGDLDSTSNNRNIFSSMRNLVEKCGETKPGNPVSRSGSDRRPDAVREESQQQQQQQNQQAQSQLPSDQHNQHQRVNSSDLSYSNDVDPAAHPDSSTSLPPSSGNRERSGKSIGRTASLKEKQPDKKNQTKKPRNRSDPLTSRHDSDQPEFPLSPSGSSTGSSSNSLRVSSVSPSSSIDAGGGLHDIQHGCANDSDLEVGYELPDWSATIPQEKLAALTPEEKKRQELINEFFHTEQYHLRKLKILDKIFYGPLTHKKVFSDCDLNLIFANLPELVEIHTCFNSAMKAKRKENPLVGEVGDLIFNMFDSPRGEELQRAAASFCERQHLALELITERRRKDQRVEAALASCEKSHHCERQNLQSFMSAEMHRVTRYPILLERLIETTHKLHSERRKDGNAESQAEELERLRLALTRCKEIVNNVNETVRTASNRSKLQEIQNHLEILIEKQIESSGLRYEHNMFVTEYKNLDLTKYTLIREDKVELLRTGRNPINLQMLLLEEAVVFLVPENEKYTLKFIQSGIPANPFLAPIIKVSSFIVRLNAAGTTTMFLLNLRAESTQMYELKAKSRNDRDVWFKQLSDAAEAYNRREMGGRAARSRPEPISATPSAVAPITTTPTSGGSPCSATATITTDGGTDDTTTQDQTSSPTTHRNGVTAAERDGAASRLDDSGVALASSTSDGAIKRRNNTMSMNSLYSNLPLDDVDEKRLSQPEMDTAASHPSTVGGGVMVKLEADDWSLVQPSEVQVAVPPVHTAQPVLTPLEKIKRKDEEVRQALADKRVLVADLLSIPLQDYHHIADMVSVQSQKPAESEPTELILAAVHQVDILLNLMNESLNVSETDAVLATGGRHASCNSNTALVNQQQNSQNVHVPSVPVHRLQSIVPLLSTQLTNLLSLTKQGEEEKMTLRKELQRTRELLHVNNSVPEEYTFDHHHQEFCQSGDLERIDESPTETDTT